MNHSMAGALNAIFQLEFESLLTVSLIGSAVGRVNRHPQTEFPGQFCRTRPIRFGGTYVAWFVSPVWWQMRLLPPGTWRRNSLAWKNNSA